MNLTKYIRDVPDFPQKGIVFKDITPLLSDPTAFRYVVDRLCDYARELAAQTIVGIDSRGFILGGAVAYALGLKFVPIRKKGKLPCNTLTVSYDLEYGTATLEIHEDALAKGERVLIIDDLLATGGTAEAALALCEELGADIVGLAFIIELGFLNGRKLLSDYAMLSLISYE